MDRAEIIARALHIARRQLKADGGSVADDFLPRLAPTPQTAHNYGRAPVFDEYGQPHDPFSGEKIEAADPSLSESLYNIATSPARVAVGAVTEPIAAASRLPSETLTGVPELDVRAKNDALALLATLYGGNAFNPLARMPANSIGMFAGRMAKTADQDALARAESLHAQGAPRDQIWNDTGWFQGADGEWRFEINDRPAFIKGALAKSASDIADLRPTVGDALYHPELMAAYPDLAEIGFGGIEGNGAQYGRSLLDGDEIKIGNDYRGDIAKSALLHELQHGVQYNEGFAPGAASDLFSRQKDAKLASDALSFRRELDRYPASMGPSARENAVVDDYRNLGAMDWLPSREVRDIAHDYHGNPSQDLQALVNLYGLDRKTTPYTPVEMYRRTAGEVEARNIQKRMGMTPEQRRAMPPWETQDIPDEQQINLLRYLP